ncbi:basic proline-rich protein isoform X1 [Gallus gallus]|uniref:basic proline-rich protein isoform X1 n=1 Tax=Gallus gallus TaxID=9031 RepID=UPI000D63FD46|nr:basic proline-rich protein isoform X1 [Gallus gallus]XP_040525513.1 basic proline-rich protein isoform X1 [Gallus gallus]|eukprot:XP_025005914.1 basic proline-rich protein-like isoform X1 [Gallus gallus]
MSRAERPAPRRRSPSRPDLLRDGAGSPLSPFYRSFFEDECRTIAARLLVGSAATPGPSPGPAESGAPWPPPAAPLVTSTPFESSPPPAAGSPPVAALLGRPRGAARRLASPRAGGRSRLARPQPRRAGQLPPGRPPARSPRRAAGRPSPARPRASVGPEPRGAGKGPGAPAAKLPAPPGAKLKAMPAAKSGLQHPTYRASQLARPSAGPKAPPRDRATETAGKAGGRRQPPQRIPTSIPTVASRSRLQPAGKAASSKRAHPGRTSESTPQEPVCNRTRELMENDKADQTWVCVGSPYLRELHPGAVSGCGDAACAAQPAGCQLSQELEHVKKELERVKGELADKTAQCEAYCQTISSLQAQLRAAGICLEDAAEDNSGIWERD